ncbi:hypothetical protein SDC9_155612 [bioreactor metagenome]|uniref:Uncharacterized protein n=1 Tax=bioreactor metagenome TaxID=1076179 RepID=A0A645F3C0_9ZZZZ
MLVGIDDVRTLARGNFDRNDLVLELAGLDGGECARVAQHGQLILLFAGDIVFGREVFSGHAHVLFIDRADKAVGGEAVKQLNVAHADVACAGQHVSGVGHALYTHADADVGFAEHDLLAAHFDGAHAGGALLVDCGGIARERQACRDLHLAGRVAAVAGAHVHAGGDFFKIFRGYA